MVKSTVIPNDRYAKRYYAKRPFNKTLNYVKRLYAKMGFPRSTRLLILRYGSISSFGLVTDVPIARISLVATRFAMEVGWVLPTAARVLNMKLGSAGNQPAVFYQVLHRCLYYNPRHILHCELHGTTKIMLLYSIGLLL